MHLPLHAYVMGAVSGATRHCEGAGTLGARSRALAQDEGTQGRWREGECIATAQV